MRLCSAGVPLGAVVVLVAVIVVLPLAFGRETLPLNPATDGMGAVVAAALTGTVLV
ncbi:MAG TPA: hypothetical protein VFN37_02215 [Candidatus Baltobacteraceae bacterium]|nr:hypothetical protein [Candidatus Baltobacteraceae bacterium]